jgi:hypothetical protein
MSNPSEELRAFLGTDPTADSNDDAPSYSPRLMCEEGESLPNTLTVQLLLPSWSGRR